MSCIGSILKQLLDFNYVRSKDDEKIISNSSVNNEYDLNGIDGNGVDQDTEND